MRCKVRFIFSLAIMVLIAACKKENIIESEVTDPIWITPNDHVVIEFESAADHKSIPMYIALPNDRSEPLLAVLVLHGSGGPWDDDDLNGDGIADVCNVGQLSAQNKQWRDLLLTRGYVAAFPDSYSPRNTCENEGAYKNPPLKFEISGTFVRNQDADGALAALCRLRWKDTNQAVIDPDNVFLVGFSDGGTAAISTLYDVKSTPPGWQWSQTFNGIKYTAEIQPPLSKASFAGFRGGIIYYPGAYHNGYFGKLCDGQGIYQSYAKVIFHLAGEDPLTENSQCLIETMSQRGGASATEFLYENVGHSFDGEEELESDLARSRSLQFILDNKLP